jgi:hypothetical protein
MAAITRTAELPVLAGLDAVVIVDGRIVGWATNFSWSEDFELQGIRTLGHHGDRGWKSMGYNCSANVGTLVLYVDAQAEDGLPYETRRSIVKSGYFTYELYDKVTQKHLYTLRDCKCGTQDVTFDSGTLVTRNTTWRVREVIPNEDNIAAVEEGSAG